MAFARRCAALARNARQLATAAEGTAGGLPVRVHNPEGKFRVVATKSLPGTRWLDILTAANCRVEARAGSPTLGRFPSFTVPEVQRLTLGCQVCTAKDTILSVAAVQALVGPRCDGAIGQLTEKWGTELFGALRAAGGHAYSNYAVGYDNVDVAAATAAGVAVGNTPGASQSRRHAALRPFLAWVLTRPGAGVLTETTAETAAALTLAAARRIAEADVFMRAGHYKGWLPDLFVGQLLQGATVGILGAGRIGAAYARMVRCANSRFGPSR